jgi:hypothetical protein
MTDLDPGTPTDVFDLNDLKAGAIGAAVGLIVGGTAGYLVGRRKKKSKSSSKSKKRRASSSKSKKRRKGSRRSRSRRRYTPHTAGKRKDRSTRRIRYTKNGQPYVLMRSGKARFIKKKGARLSHRRKGGRY